MMFISPGSNRVPLLYSRGNRGGCSINRILEQEKEEETPKATPIIDLPLTILSYFVAFVLWALFIRYTKDSNIQAIDLFVCLALSAAFTGMFGMMKWCALYKLIIKNITK